jgi:hypothetical protein
MRNLVIFAAAAATGLVLSAVPSPVAAQCATGCSSSASCDGTGKATCHVHCEGGLCNCTDIKCKTEPLPPPELAHSSALPSFVAAPVEGMGTSAIAVTVELMVDCGGNVVDVLLTRRDGSAVFHELPLIALSPPAARRDHRIAVRE